MEVIKLKRNELMSALNSLNEALDLFVDLETQKWRKSFRDSLIQRFEYTFDIFWKYLKLWITEKHNPDLEISSPRGIVREAEIVDLITEEEKNLLLECIDSRNLTSHSYKDSTAEQIASRIEVFYKLMKTVTDRMT